MGRKPIKVGLSGEDCGMQIGSIPSQRLESYFVFRVKYQARLERKQDLLCDLSD